LISGIAVYYGFIRKDAIGEDIYYIYVEGQRIVQGENPYARVHESDMISNDKYATYFPLFYLMAAGMQSIGLEDYKTWLIAWRILNLIVFGLLCYLVVQYCYPRFGAIGTLTLGAIWQFNTFTLMVMKIAHIDFLAVLFLIWSILLLGKKNTLALLFFGISLSIKQIGIFMIPVYLVHFWLESKGNIKEFGKFCFLMGIIPFLVSLPFLYWDATGYIKSVLFSATRGEDNHFGTIALEKVLHLSGLAAKIPMLLIMCALAYLYLKKHLGIYTSSFLIFAVFVGMNSVLFRQYLVWPIMFIPFMLGEMKNPNADMIGQKPSK
jgi:hypothetical protein